MTSQSFPPPESPWFLTQYSLSFDSHFLSRFLRLLLSCCRWQGLMQCSVGCWETAMLPVTALLRPQMSVWRAAPTVSMSHSHDHTHTHTILFDVQITAVSKHRVGDGEGWNQVCVCVPMCVCLVVLQNQRIQSDVYPCLFLCQRRDKKRKDEKRRCEMILQ